MRKAGVAAAGLVLLVLSTPSSPLAQSRSPQSVETTRLRQCCQAGTNSQVHRDAPRLPDWEIDFENDKHSINAAIPT